MPMFRKSLLDVSQSMMAANDAAEFFAVTGRALADLGCHDFTFAGSTSVRLGPQAMKMGLKIYFITLLAAKGNETVIPALFVRRFLQNGQESVFTDPSIYADASADDLAQRQLRLDAGKQHGYFGILSRIPGHFTAICCFLEDVAAAGRDRQGPEIYRKLLLVGQIMDAVFLSKYMGVHFALSPRERDVLSLLAAGHRPDEIAHRLGIGAGTVDKHIVSAKEKLSARTRDHAVARALMLGLIDL